MSDKLNQFEVIINNKLLTVEFDSLTWQSSNSVLVNYDNNVILMTLIIGKELKISDFLPLTINMPENLFAVGKIPGSFNKRENRGNDYVILIARIIDRCIRPMLKNIFREIQITVNVLAINEAEEIEWLSVLGTSLLLSTTNLPFEPVVLLKHKSLQNTIMVGASENFIHVLESENKEQVEIDFLSIIKKLTEKMVILFEFQKRIKSSFFKPCDVGNINVINEFLSTIKIDKHNEELQKILLKKGQATLLDELAKRIQTEKDSVNTNLSTEQQILLIKKTLVEQLALLFKRKVLTGQVRLDNRKSDEIRPLSMKVNYLPNVHGSALFNRGMTQVLSIVTLSDLEDYQIIDGWKRKQKTFFHHYRFPAYSVGEITTKNFLSRREIGHGMLGEKSIKMVLPQTEFPYVIRLNSEVFSSDGSTSQASICAASLALMSAGVPISKHIAGIAIGGIFNHQEGDFTMCDISGLEDQFGNLDLKISGTTYGICATQMDTKNIMGLTIAQLEKLFATAKEARLQIINKMTKIIASPAKEVASNVTKVKVFQIPTAKIGEIIGNGGKTINWIIKMTDNTKIKIDSLKGEVLIYHLDPKMIINAWTLIQSLLQSVYTNAVFFAELVRIEKTKLIFKIKERFFGYIILHFFDDNKYQIENFYWVKITKVIPINQIELAFTQAPNTWKK